MGAQLLDDLLAAVARLYYLDELGQQDIAAITRIVAPEAKALGFALAEALAIIGIALAFVL